MQLKLPLEPRMLPMAVTFAETAAQGAGLGAREIGLLALSVEELFLALCETMPGAEIQVGFRDRRHAVEIRFHFPQAPPDLRVFNLTARPDHETEEGLANMGLFLASRASDRFGVQPLRDGGWEILLRKDRAYPPGESRPPPPARGTWRVPADPGPEAVKQLSALIGARYAAAQFPEDFTPPGRLLDKLAGGDYGAILALGEQGGLAGGLVWHTSERRVVECFGPYLNDAPDPQALVETLCEQVCARFGRSPHSGLVLQAPGPLPAAAGFEPAGQLETPAGTLWVGYRMLAEEFGAPAWVPEGLLEFYRQGSERMALARDVRPTRDDGEAGDGLTLFAARLDRAVGMAQLSPLLVGRDARAVLAEHLALLDGEGIRTLQCVLDTGRPFAALLAPHLLAQGFEPRVLVPWGGTGDQLHLYRRG